MSFSLTKIKIVPGKPTERFKYLVQLSDQLFNELLINENHEITITIGQKTILTAFQKVDLPANELLIPENMIADFCLPIQTFEFQAVYTSEIHNLKLGPVVGLLTNFTSTNQDEPYFRSIHTFCEELHHQITKQGGFFYVFAYDQFLNQGFYLDKDKWRSIEPPLPDVIYNRIHSRKLEQKEGFKHFRNRLEQLMIPIFNDRFLSKWEVHEQISKEKQLLPYIPETKIFSKEHLYTFIQKYEAVFIKPINGSNGRNILKVMKEMENLYTIQTSLTEQADFIGKKYELDEIYQLIKPLLHNRIYIIQQGIALVTHEARAVDFRVLCHKSSLQQWEITSIVARIATEQEFTTNISRGGMITKPLNVLRPCLGRNKSVEVLILMKELALQISSVISSHSPGITGELGIDIGVDEHGKLWLIEVNSKPSKNFDEGLGKIRPSAKAIGHFCAKLSFE